MNDTPRVPVQRPAVVVWFWVYCIATVVCSFFWLVAIAIAFFSDHHHDDEDVVVLVVMAAMTLPAMAAYAIAPLLPRRRWAWIYDLVLICLALSSCCCLPICVPLLIFWLRPETQAWFKTDEPLARA